MKTFTSEVRDIFTLYAFSYIFLKAFVESFKLVTNLTLEHTYIYIGSKEVHIDEMRLVESLHVPRMKYSLSDLL